jgi:hypothetical protein
MSVREANTNKKCSTYRLGKVKKKKKVKKKRKEKEPLPIQSG